ncbi:unnamed protein product [Allacma fusca]|uniref:Uncharacterized protein n=1 Tax=Allacma fusca TaxID=39272 RepID=A0A8J2KBY2_9HEXA|nr:unnamed protein product [Allacma fusca]
MKKKKKEQMKKKKKKKKEQRRKKKEKDTWQALGFHGVQPADVRHSARVQQTGGPFGPTHINLEQLHTF